MVDCLQMAKEMSAMKMDLEALQSQAQVQAHAQARNGSGQREIEDDAKENVSTSNLEENYRAQYADLQNKYTADLALRDDINHKVRNIRAQKQSSMLKSIITHLCYCSWLKR
jgi:hypothetical protein